MKINPDFSKIVFATLMFGSVLYVSHVFADEPQPKNDSAVAKQTETTHPPHIINLEENLTKVKTQ